MTDMVIDANSLYARSWYAAQRISNEPHEPLRLVLQTLLLLLSPRSDRICEKIDRMLFCWDGAKKIEKNRADKPTAYHEMKNIVRDAMTFAFGTPHAEHADYEGDDIVATAACHSSADIVYVVSGDKDLMQLQGGRVRYYCLNQKATLSRQFILSKWHIKHPNQLAVALAIIGDPVDNIPGIPRWGPKKVEKLFESIPSGMPLDQVIEAIIAQIPGELQPAFWESLNRTLLNSDVPGIPEPVPVQLADPDAFAELGVPGIASFYDDVWNLYNRRQRPAEVEELD